MSAAHGSYGVNPIAKAASMLKSFQLTTSKVLNPWNKHKQQVSSIKSLSTGAGNIVYFWHHILKGTDPIGLFKVRFYSCTLHHVLCVHVCKKEVTRVTRSCYICNTAQTVVIFHCSHIIFVKMHRKVHICIKLHFRLLECHAESKWQQCRLLQHRGWHICVKD